MAGWYPPTFRAQLTPPLQWIIVEFQVVGLDLQIARSPALPRSPILQGKTDPENKKAGPEEPAFNPGERSPGLTAYILPPESR